MSPQAEACNTDTTQTQPHRNSNTHRTENKTTYVVIQQHSRKLLMMDILMSETCWAHKKWNIITSYTKLAFYSSTVKMMHGPVNIRSIPVFKFTLRFMQVVVIAWVNLNALLENSNYLLQRMFCVKWELQVGPRSSEMYHSVEQQIRADVWEKNLLSFFRCVIPVVFYLQLNRGSFASKHKYLIFARNM